MAIFPVGSRYHGIEIAKYEMSAGKGETEPREIAYLRHRFFPALSTPADDLILTEHVVTQGERLDNITARYLGDPEQFWRVCDANNAMLPQALTEEIGRRLRIPLDLGGTI
ncbi:LysM peptidoglycan-binding domain-containing protein [Nitrosospira briensis]|uniref:LysM peptidoglycan-binding domain-containing protein n=1 Tax=Nitrosospira briensis TaxID=35799 RepID=UPI0008EEEE38|nr:LysM domain-containing protein [Nitrosospira briensis]SFN69867.1 hypothetical protein SAMN05216332_101245 [Nitrosospira briensis]